MPGSGDCCMPRLRKKLGTKSKRGVDDDAPPGASTQRRRSSAVGIVPQKPIPEDENEINELFAELVNELGLDKLHRDAMFSLPPAKKWQIYINNKQEHTGHSTADDYIDKLTSMPPPKTWTMAGDNEAQRRLDLIGDLKMALRTQPMSFVLKFIQLNGLDLLFTFLGSADHASSSHGSLHAPIVGCIKALMNSSEGRSHVLAHPSGVNAIAQCLSVDNVRTKIAVLEMLGAMCLVTGGHRKVLLAMIHLQQHTAERTRFQSVIYDLDRTTGDYRDDVNLKTASMSFINAALKYGPGETSLEFRLHLRYEFLMLGIQPIIDKLRDLRNETLDRHLDFFESMRGEDEKEFAKRFQVSHVDTRSATAMFEMIRKKLSVTQAYPHLLSIFMHLLQLPFANALSVQYWQLIDRVVQQVAIQSKDGDPDGKVLDIDVKKLCKHIDLESTAKEANTKVRDLQKEVSELTSKLTKKEHEVEVKMQEKEGLVQMLNKLNAKQAETKAQLDEKLAQVLELERLLQRETAERSRLELAVKTGSLPDDAKADFSNTSSTRLLAPMTSPASYSFTTSSNDGTVPSTQTSLPSIPPPPMPPPGGPPGSIPPPPPMPPGLGGAGPGKIGLPGMPSIKKKKVPQSTQPLKSFNWTKIPDNQIQGTIWVNIDDTKVYKELDLTDFEKNFSAYHKNEGGDLDSSLFGKSSSRTAELSVIDGRRAQNCTILLSKLKMTNDEVAEAVLSVDTHEEISKDMCEQLLKFVPTPEEVQMLTEHEQSADQMARADRFLLEMSRINHYEERLKALYYKKKFHERTADAKPKIEAVLEASKEVLNSKSLRKLLTLVLAYGNYMNRGQRGNASAFKVASLNKIIDTKSSVNVRATFMHYLADVVQHNFEEVMKLDAELQHVRHAAKISLSDLDSEMAVLRAGLRDVEKEVEYHRGAQQTPASVKFVAVMSEFVSVAAFNFSDLDEQQHEMKLQYNQAVLAFGEESNKIQPDEFFAIFDQFLISFNEAIQDNERFRRQKEEEEKRARIEAEQRAERERKQRSHSTLKDAALKGEFDDLVTALRTGAVFGEDMNKRPGVRRGTTPRSAVPPETTPRTGRRTSSPKITPQWARERDGIVERVATQ